MKTSNKILLIMIGTLFCPITNSSQSLYHINYSEICGNKENISNFEEGSIIIWLEADSPFGGEITVEFDSPRLYLTDKDGHEVEPSDEDLIVELSKIPNFDNWKILGGEAEFPIPTHKGADMCKNDNPDCSNVEWRRSNCNTQEGDPGCWTIDSNKNLITTLKEDGKTTHTWPNKDNIKVCLNDDQEKTGDWNGEVKVKIQGNGMARIGYDFYLHKCNDELGTKQRAVNGQIVTGPTDGWKTIKIREDDCNIESLTVTVNKKGSGEVKREPFGIDCNVIKCGYNKEGVVLYKKGDTVKLVATPVDGYLFNGWIGDVCKNTIKTTCEVVMDKPKTITATFIQDFTTKTVLESPQQNSYESGIGLIRGWACQANKVEFNIDDGVMRDIPYGSNRGDTEPVCGDKNNGFGFTYNWNSLTNGTHTIKLFIDGTEVATANFTTTNLGVPYLQGASGECEVSDFPEFGDTTNLRWSEPHQNFVIVP